MFRSDREDDHRGGGVLLYVRSDINHVQTKMKSNFADDVMATPASRAAR